MNEPETAERRPLLALLLLHLAAAGACFGFLAGIPIAGTLLVMWIDGDPGGPMFFLIFVIFVLAFALVATSFVAAAALASEFLYRRRHVHPVLPPLLVFALATAAGHYFLEGVHPIVWPMVGGIVTLAFIGYWLAISLLPPLLLPARRSKT